MNIRVVSTVFAGGAWKCTPTLLFGSSSELPDRYPYRWMVVVVLLAEHQPLRPPDLTILGRGRALMRIRLEI